MESLLPPFGKLVSIPYYIASKEWIDLPPSPNELTIYLDYTNPTFVNITCQGNQSIVQWTEQPQNILTIKGVFRYVTNIL